MSFIQTLVLGTISGFTIFLGLPLARLRRLNNSYLSFLNALAIGVLFFLFWDVMQNAATPVEDSITGGTHATWYLLPILLGGFGIGLLSLVYFSRRFFTQRRPAQARNVALLIAAGIGLHNFSEGLAIGNSAAAGELTLAVTLISGFALHNITEGFGIAGPLANERPSWRFLGVAGLIGGGPNFIGTLIGYRVTSDPLSVLFLALAGGAIMYVIGDLLNAGRKLNEPVWSGWGLMAGFAAGLLTDLLLVAAGS